MKTLLELTTPFQEAAKADTSMAEMPWGDACLDHRDLTRIIGFIPHEHAQQHMRDIFKPEALKDDSEWEEAQPLTRENVLKCLQSALYFAREKADDERGISANLMYNVLRMWVWVLDDAPELLDHEYEDDNYGKHFQEMLAGRYDLKLYDEE